MASGVGFFFFFFGASVWKQPVLYALITLKKWFLILFHVHFQGGIPWGVGVFFCFVFLKSIVYSHDRMSLERVEALELHFYPILTGWPLTRSLTHTVITWLSGVPVSCWESCWDLKDLLFWREGCSLGASRARLTGQSRDTPASLQELEQLGGRGTQSLLVTVSLSGSRGDDTTAGWCWVLSKTS